MVTAGRGAAVKFVGGVAGGRITVSAEDDPPEFMDYDPNDGSPVAHYRHYARPTDRCPYHLYKPFESEAD